jgi:hypothetical protein
MDTCTERHDASAENPSQPPSKSLRRDRNDQKWEAHKNEIYGLYIEENNTLPETMRVIEKRHGFTARSADSFHTLEFVPITRAAFGNGKTKSRKIGALKRTSPRKTCKFSLPKLKNARGMRARRLSSGTRDRRSILSGSKTSRKGRS